MRKLLPMPRISLRSLALVVTSAILQIASFPISGPAPPFRAALSFISLVPLLLAVLSNPRSDGRFNLSSAPILNAASSVLLGYLCGIIFYVGNCFWIYQTMYLYGGLPKPVAILILFLFALYLGLYHALFSLLLWFAARSRLGIGLALALTPFIWVTVELARARITGFPWDLLGNSEVDNSILTRLAPLGGVMLISFILSATSALIVFAILHRRARIAVLSCVALAILLIHAGSSHFAAPLQQPTQTAILLQENLSVGATGREERRISLAQELADFSSLTTLSLKNQQAPPALIIWPEAPSHLQSSDPTFRAAMSNLANSTHAPLIIGSLGVDYDQTSPRGYFLYDSASLFTSTGTYQGRYDKIHLVPWGEYIPFKDFFAFAQKLTEGAGDMDRGTARTLFTTAGHSYGVFICYESIFGDEVRHFVANGAEALVNISDDGWYGDTGAPWQHLNMARMRAIENQRWLLRATNTGVTAAIDPWGRVISPAPRHTRAAFTIPFAYTPATTLTLYTRFGDWFAYLCTLITLLALAYALLTRPRRIV